MIKVCVFIFLLASNSAVAAAMDFNLSRHREFHKKTQKDPPERDRKKKVRVSASNERAL